MRIALASALLSQIVLPLPASGQAPSGLEPGRRMRVHAPAAVDARQVPLLAHPLIGSFQGLGRDSLRLIPLGELRPVSVSLADLERVEVSAGQRSRWLIGAAAGAAVGVTVRLATGYDSARQIAEGVAVFGALGAGLGALFKTERWEDVALDALDPPIGRPGAMLEVRVPLRTPVFR